VRYSRTEAGPQRAGRTTAGRQAGGDVTATAPVNAGKENAKKTGVRSSKRYPPSQKKTRFLSPTARALPYITQTL